MASILALLVSHVATSQAPSAALQQADAAYREGQAALAHQDLAAAQTAFEKVLRLAPAAEQGHSALGAVLVNRGHPQEGIRELERALAIQKTDGTAQMNLAMAYQQVGQDARALPLFAHLEAGAKAENHTLPPYVLAAYARALAATGSLAPAAAQMKTALRAEPQNPALHDELGSIYARQKAWPNARQEFATATQLDPTLAIAHLHLGLALQAQQQPGAMVELAEAERLAPANPVIAMELGRALATTDKDDQAIPLFRRVLEQEPANTGATYELALAFQRTNKVREALPLLRSVVAAEPANAAALTNLGLALTQLQQAKDAVPILERSIALAPGDVTAHQNLAAAYVQLSQFADAVRELQVAARLAPDSPQVHYDLGLALKMQDATAAAIPELEAAVRLDPAAPEAPFVLGVLYNQTARYEDAARNLRLSLKLRPENGDGWAMLGSVESKLNLLQDAVQALNEAIRQLPDQPDPHLTLAAVLVKQNQPADAAMERRKAADLMRTNMSRQRAEVATNAGNSLLQAGDLAGATLQFRDALSYDPKYADAHLGLAKVLDSQGKTVDAAAERQKAATP